MTHERMIASALGQEKCCKDRAKEIGAFPIEDIGAFLNGKSQLKEEVILGE